MNLTDLELGAAAAFAIALLALRLHALSRSGAIAAFVVGTLTFGSGALGTALLLLAFFITSTLLSRAGKARKRELVDLGKGGARDAWQVLANGGIATLCAVAWALLDRSTPASLWFVAFAGAYAAATADTWGTEIGTLAAEPPRSIRTGQPLATGLSGGVSPPGTAAEIAGSVLIALLAPFALFLALPQAQIAVAIPHLLTPLGIRAPIAALTLFVAFPVFAGGVAGAVADSWLGETLQDRRWCPHCERECETDPHHCGTPTTRRRGLPWMTNDTVNLVATATGGLVAAAFGLALRALLPT